MDEAFQRGIRGAHATRDRQHRSRHQWHIIGDQATNRATNLERTNGRWLGSPRRLSAHTGITIPTISQTSGTNFQPAVRDEQKQKPKRLD